MSDPWISFFLTWRISGHLFCAASQSAQRAQLDICSFCVSPSRNDPRKENKLWPVPGNKWKTMAILYIGAKVPRTRSIYGLPNDKATSRSPTLAVIFKPAPTHIQKTPRYCWGHSPAWDTDPTSFPHLLLHIYQDLDYKKIDYFCVNLVNFQMKPFGFLKILKSFNHFRRSFQNHNIIRNVLYKI